MEQDQSGTNINRGEAKKRFRTKRKSEAGLADMSSNFSLYLRDTAEYKRLSPEEEIRMARLIYEYRQLQECPVMNEEILKKLDEGRKEYEETREIFILSNKGLVTSYAKRYQGHGVSYDDLVSEGNTALIKAVDKFNPNRGVKFSTHATWWIRQALGLCLDNDARTIRVSVYTSSDVRKMVEFEEEYGKRIGGCPERGELETAMMEKFGWDYDKVERLVKARRVSELVELNQPMTSNDGEKGEFGDFLEDRNCPSPEEHVTTKLEMDLVHQLLHKLEVLFPGREYANIILHGFIGGLSYDEIGDTLDLTSDTVRQRRKKALKMLKGLVG